MKNALIIGNSGGIGLAVTRKLLQQDWRIVGLSRSASPIDHETYEHHQVDVQEERYIESVKGVLDTLETLDLCIYCPGIGDLLDLTDMRGELEIFDVNLMGLVKTAGVVIPWMVDQRSGHLIGLSSVADEMLSAEAPSYHASKAGFSSYLESLALALKDKGVYVTNVRFGFVDTKMAKGDVKPFMINAEQAAQHLLRCIEKRPIRYTAPWIVKPLVGFRRWTQRLSVGRSRAKGAGPL